ncbi:MAG: ATP-dependent sacrificial sulfur transferase LarE, partial [Nitrospirae bacterium]|nr:ATP-dependent sacrificial sulfur transferase LarE [Nitrospirota bacterium]
KKLKEIIRDSGSAVIALSGGVDSSLVAAAAKDADIKILAVTSRSEITDPEDIASTAAVVSMLNLRHKIIYIDMLSEPEFIANNKDRCYVCKKKLFTILMKIAETEGFANIFDGSNTDDVNDWRPGMKAVLEYNARSPLIEAGFTKNDVRQTARALGLKCWNRPSAPCLATRFPYGAQISSKGLKMVKAAEDYLRSLGFTELRVRISGVGAKIELKEEELHIIAQPVMRQSVLNRFASIGFDSTTIDLEGFISGKLNRQRP